MTSPLTRAARELVKSQSGVDCYDDLEPEAQEAARDHVRAVLLAVRDPSDGMLDRGYANHDYNDGLDDDARADNRHIVGCIWQAMIDAALSE